MKSAIGSNNNSKEKQGNSNGPSKCRTQLNSCEKRGNDASLVKQKPKVSLHGLRTTVNLYENQGMMIRKASPPDTKDMTNIQKLVNKHYVCNFNQNTTMRFTPSTASLISKNSQLKTKNWCNNETAKTRTNSQTRPNNSAVGKVISQMSHVVSTQASNVTQVDHPGAPIKNLKVALIKDSTKKYSRNSPNLNKITHRQDNTMVKRVSNKLVGSKAAQVNDVVILTSTFGSKAETSLTNANFKYLNTSTNTNTNTKAKPSVSSNHPLLYHPDEVGYKSKNLNYLNQYIPSKYNNEDLNVHSNYKSSQRTCNYSNLHSNSNSQSTQIFSCNNTNKNSKNISRNNFFIQHNLERPQLQYSKIEPNKSECKSNSRSNNCEDATIPEGLGLILDMNNGSTLRVNYKNNAVDLNEDLTNYNHHLIEQQPVSMYDQICKKLVKEEAIHNYPRKASVSQDYFSELSINRKSNPIQGKDKDGKTRSSNEAIVNQTQFRGKNFESTTSDNINNLYNIKIDGPEEFHFIQVKFGIKYTKELALKFEHLDEIRMDNQNGNLNEVYDSDEEEGGQIQ